METCPSPEIGDSRKRPLDTDPETEQTKRSHFSSGKFFFEKKKNQKKFSLRKFIISLSCYSLKTFFLSKKKKKIKQTKIFFNILTFPFFYHMKSSLSF